VTENYGIRAGDERAFGARRVISRGPLMTSSVKYIAREGPFLYRGTRGGKCEFRAKARVGDASGGEQGGEKIH